MIHTKIVCTIGPASDSVEILEQLIKEGMDVARLNFSHGTYEEHGHRIAMIRQAAENMQVPVAIILDTKGPEIRIGKLQEGRVPVDEGQEVILTARDIVGYDHVFPVTYSGLPQDVAPGNEILIDDGLVGLEVLKITGADIHCRVKNKGELLPHKSVNLPGLEVSMPGVTENDVADILFGIRHDLDFIAASFVRKAADILLIRKILEENQTDMDIIAKIENHSGVNNIDEILKVADGIMVARGDLGVEIPPEEVPLVQKMIIDKCNKAGKPVITATQMLDSMIRNPRPTRAEASDVANAIFDGTDAVMLSGETAAGKYPVEAVKTMNRIAFKAETILRYDAEAKGVKTSPTITDAISHASHQIAEDLHAAAIITPTSSGSTPKMVSKYRPAAMIIAATTSPKVRRKLSLVSGVNGILINQTRGTDNIISEAVTRALDAQMIKPGDLVVVTAGVPVGNPGTTNLIKVQIIGEAAASGTGIGKKVASGTARRVNSGEEAARKIMPGDILVAVGTDQDYLPGMEKAGAIITEEGGLTSHAAMAALDLGIPAVVGAAEAFSIIPDNVVVTVDGVRGKVYLGVTNVL